VKTKHAKYNFLKKIFISDMNSRKSVPYKRGDTSVDFCKTLESNGTMVVKNFFDRYQIEEISKKVDASFDQLKNVSPGRNLHGLTEENMVEFFKNCGRLDEKSLKKGQNFYRNITDNIQIKNPFLSIPEVFKLASDNRITDIAYDYLGACPAITYAKIVRNFSNKIPEFDTQYFHIDKHASKMFKVFIYLKDVKEGGGPHCFMKGSHSDKSKKKYWERSTILPSTITDKDAIEMFGKDSFTRLYGNAGDIVIEDTTGWHKAEKPLLHDRDVAIITYGIGKEYSYYENETSISVSKDQFDGVKNKRILDFMEILDE
jgi:hypothetical protein